MKEESKWRGPRTARHVSQQKRDVCASGQQQVLYFAWRPRLRRRSFMSFELRSRLYWRFRSSLLCYTKLHVRVWYAFWAYVVYISYPTQESKYSMSYLLQAIVYIEQAEAEDKLHRAQTELRNALTIVCRFYSQMAEAQIWYRRYACFIHEFSQSAVYESLRIPIPWWSWEVDQSHMHGLSVFRPIELACWCMWMVSDRLWGWNRASCVYIAIPVAIANAVSWELQSGNSTCMWNLRT